MRLFDLWRWRQFWGRDWRGKTRTVREWLTGDVIPYLSITTAPSCPLHCACCPWETFARVCKERNIGMMSMKTFSAILEHTPPWVMLDFAGFSESTLNPLMPDMALLAHH
jgi:hypothetical protein